MWQTVVDTEEEAESETEEESDAETESDPDCRKVVLHGLSGQFFSLEVVCPAAAAFGKAQKVDIVGNR